MPPEDVSVVTKCPEMKVLFPENKARAFKMTTGGDDESGTKWAHFEDYESGAKLSYVEDDSELQEAILESAKNNDTTWLAKVNENMAGMWLFTGPDGSPLASHYTWDLLERAVPPEKMHLVTVCEEEQGGDGGGEKSKALKTHEFDMHCKNWEYEEHIELGWEGSPCTWMGKCDDDMLCVKKHQFLAQCMLPEDVPEDAEIIDGPTPTWPWDNCYWSKTCAVEGYQCFRNDRWKTYARCMPADICPKPRGKDIFEVQKEELGVRRLQDLTFQRVQRKLLEKPEKFGYPASWQGEKGVHKRRRLSACMEKHGKEQGLGSLSDLAGQGHFHGASHVAAAQAILEDPECQAMDFSEQEAVPSENVELKFDQMFSLENMDLGWDWLDEKLYQENGGSEGWDCENPLGPVASVETGALSEREARVQAHKRGWRPWEVVPEGREERRRRRRLQEEKRRLQAENGLGSFPFRSIEALQEHEHTHGGDGMFFSDPAMHQDPDGLPHPPDEEEHSHTNCGDVPHGHWAPEKNIAFELVCAPHYVWAPVYSVSPTFHLAPDFVWGPVFIAAPEVILAPHANWAPKVMLAPAVICAPEFTFAPKVILGGEYILAPENIFLPLVLAGVEIVLTPTTVAPDIFADWVLDSKNTKESKVKRFDEKNWKPKESKGPKEFCSKYAKKEEKEECEKELKEKEKEEHEGVIDPASIADSIVGPSQELAEEIAETVIFDTKLTEKQAALLGLRPSFNLGAFFLYESGIVFGCPRYYINLETGEQENRVKIFIYEPRDERLEEEGKLELSEHCVVPYPSDVLRDLPFLSKEAAPAILALEALENAIPPPLKILVNQVYSFATVLAAGNFPNATAWLENFSKEYGGEPITDEEIKEREKEAGGKMDWNMAMAMAMEKVPLAVIKNLPDLFPKDNPVFKLAYGIANAVGYTSTLLFEPIGIFWDRAIKNGLFAKFNDEEEEEEEGEE